MKIGIQYYYCCAESDYHVYDISDVSEDFKNKLDTIYEGDMTEISFTSKRFEFLLNILFDSERYDNVDLDTFYDCDYKFLYIICK